MMMEYAGGKATNNPPAPKTNHVSLPSQKGAMEFMILLLQLVDGR